MWYYVQPPLASLSLAASVAAAAASGDLRGASLLNLLHSRSAAVAGDGRLICNITRGFPYINSRA
jgi:gamma-tubulin complex component 2